MNKIKKVLIGTNNEGKYKEIYDLLPNNVKKYSLVDKELRGEAYKKLNPLGRVPVLEDDDVTIYESGAIIEYIIAKYDNRGLKPSVENKNLICTNHNTILFDGTTFPCSFISTS